LGCSSTHEGEERTVLADGNAKLLRDLPDRFCSDTCPAIPKTAATRFEVLAHDAGADRSNGASLGDGRRGGKFYLADYVGELGLWYSLFERGFFWAALFLPIGGPQPFEVAQSGAAVLRQTCRGFCRTSMRSLKPKGAAADCGRTAEDLSPCSCRS